MEFCTIKKDADDINIVEWNKIIDDFDNLEQMPDMHTHDPFNNEEILFSGKGKAYFINNNERVGNINLEHGVLLTNAVPISVCEKIARSLAAKVYEDDLI